MDPIDSVFKGIALPTAIKMDSKSRLGSLLKNMRGWLTFEGKIKMPIS